MVHNTGAKYSVLLQLSYYDAVRFVLIDPMHNLFLGLAKSTLKVWKENDLIGEKDFELLQRSQCCCATSRNWKNPLKNCHRI